MEKRGALCSTTQMGGSNSNHTTHPPQRKRPSWIPTFTAQVLICLTLYATFAIWRTPRVQKSNTTYGGTTRKRGFQDGSIARSTDMYFLSVSGGSRPFSEQTQLLQQMALAAKIFNAKFVVGLSELGESDPLFLNATRHFPSLNISWYTNRYGNIDEKGHFLEHVKLSHGQTLDIIPLDTVLLQEESLSGTTQINRLTSMLSESSSIWRVIVGYHPLIDCTKETDGTQSLKPSDNLHNLFLKHKVNVYLSNLGCSGHYSRHSGIAYIGNPSYPNENFSGTVENVGSRTLEIHDVFLLHRVSPLEIESYFINSVGEVLSRYTLPQRGRDVM